MENSPEFGDSGAHSGGDEDRTSSPTSQGSSRSDGEDGDDGEEAASLILAQATQAARNAARALHNKKPTSTVSGSYI